MITTHYHTGFFQDVSFSKKREQTLVYLDSLINEISGQKLSTPLNLINDDITVKKIKQIVENSNFFSAIAALDRFKWEKEYIDWQKRQLKQSEVDFALKIESTSDSVVIKSLQKKKAESIIQIDSILAKEQTLKSYYFKYLTEKLETLLKKRQESSQTSYIRYHLGELYYSDENLKYTHEYNRYEANLSLYQQKLTDFRNGKIVNHPQKPDQPKLDHAKSIVQFKSILAQPVRSDITAPAYYSLGW
jgi:hypothetical protein